MIIIIYPISFIVFFEYLLFQSGHLFAPVFLIPYHRLISLHCHYLSLFFYHDEFFFIVYHCLFIIIFVLIYIIKYRILQSVLIYNQQLCARYLCSFTFGDVIYNASFFWKNELENPKSSFSSTFLPSKNISPDTRF